MRERLTLLSAIGAKPFCKVLEKQKNVSKAVRALCCLQFVEKWSEIMGKKRKKKQLKIMDNTEQISLNPAVAVGTGVFRHPRLAGGGGGALNSTHVITRERMAAERRATRRSKALDETILKHPLNFPNKVTCQVKVRSKVKIRAFRLRAVETSKLSVLGQNLLRILLKYRERQWLSKYLLLSSVQGQDQVLKGHHT